MRTFFQKPKIAQQATSAGTMLPSRARSGRSREVDSIHHLQHMVGKQAVQQLLQIRERGLEKSSFISEASSFFRDFTGIPVYADRPKASRAEEGANQRFNIPIAQSRKFAIASSRFEAGDNLSKNPSFLPVTCVAEPLSNGSLDKPEEPLGAFNEEETEALSVPPVSAVEKGDTVPNNTETAAGGQSADVAQPAQAASMTRTVIRGPREMWNFNGAIPVNYAVSSRLSTNRTGGTFRWSVSPQLALSSAADATPTVTTVTPSTTNRDAWIRVRHTDPGGTRTAASYRLTVLSPDSLTHLRNIDSPNAGFGYQTEIHYSISDQFGATLPRNVPINEQWSGPAVIDFPGGNWRRPSEGSATVNPSDWHDFVTGVSAGTGFIPDPVAPNHADAGVAAQHWPGDWRVGSLTIGNGRRVSSVTWQRNRGFARHR
jgi:hypothetical protein